MAKIKALLLTEGMHGMISQVEGLAKSLDLNFKHHKVKLKKFWEFIPPKLTPISESILKEKFVFDSQIVISCGRKSVVPSIILKKKHKNNIFNIHIQDPKVSYSNFDLIICPEHDGINGKNILNTNGAIHYLTLQEIKKFSNYIKFEKEGKKIITFILGGPNKYYDFSEPQLDKMFSKVKNSFTPDKHKIIVIPSYRTPQNIIKMAYNSFSHDHIVIKEVDKKAYLSSLDLADIIVVTCDSTSMISEAAITGKPIYVGYMKTKRSNSRFRSFYDKFENMKIIKDLNLYQSGVDTWTYDEIDELKRITPEINERMKKNGII